MQKFTSNDNVFVFAQRVPAFLLLSVISQVIFNLGIENDAKMPKTISLMWSQTSLFNSTVLLQKQNQFEEFIVIFIYKLAFHKDSIKNLIIKGLWRIVNYYGLKKNLFQGHLSHLYHFHGHKHNVHRKASSWQVAL